MYITYITSYHSRIRKETYSRILETSETGKGVEAIISSIRHFEGRFIDSRQADALLWKFKELNSRFNQLYRVLEKCYSIEGEGMFL